MIDAVILILVLLNLMFTWTHFRYSSAHTAWKIKRDEEKAIAKEVRERTIQNNSNVTRLHDDD